MTRGSDFDACRTFCENETEMVGCALCFVLCAFLDSADRAHEEQQMRGGQAVDGRVWDKFPDGGRASASSWQSAGPCRIEASAPRCWILGDIMKEGGGGEGG